MDDRADCYCDPVSLVKIDFRPKGQERKMIGMIDKIFVLLYEYGVITMGQYRNLFTTNYRREKRQELHWEIAGKLYQMTQNSNLGEGDFDPWDRKFGHTKLTKSLLHDDSFWKNVKFKFLSKKRATLADILRHYREIRDSDRNIIANTRL